MCNFIQDKREKRQQKKETNQKKTNKQTRNKQTEKQKRTNEQTNVQINEHKNKQMRPNFSFGSSKTFLIIQDIRKQTKLARTKKKTLKNCRMTFGKK